MEKETKKILELGIGLVGTGIISFSDLILKALYRYLNIPYEEINSSIAFWCGIGLIVLAIVMHILDIKKVNIDDDLYFKIRNGQIIKNLYGKEEVMFLYKDCVVSIYRIYEKDNTLLKPHIMIERDL